MNALFGNINDIRRIYFMAGKVQKTLTTNWYVLYVA